MTRSQHITYRGGWWLKWKLIWYRWRIWPYFAKRNTLAERFPKIGCACFEAANQFDFGNKDIFFWWHRLDLRLQSCDHPHTNWPMKPIITDKFVAQNGFSVQEPKFNCGETKATFRHVRNVSFILPFHSQNVLKWWRKGASWRPFFLVNKMPCLSPTQSTLKFLEISGVQKTVITRKGGSVC